MQSTAAAELVSGRVYPAHCCRVQAVSAPVASTGDAAVVASTSSSAPASTAGRLRRRPDGPSTTVSRSRTSLTQTVERCRRLYRRLCRVKLNAYQQAEQHYRGKLHAKKSKTMMMMMMNTTRETSPAAPSLQAADTQVRTNMTRPTAGWSKKGCPYLFFSHNFKSARQYSLKFLAKNYTHTTL